MKNSKKSNILPNIPAFCASVCGQLHLPLFVDIETTGFSGARNRLCLIGTAYLQNGSLVTEQFFCRIPAGRGCTGCGVRPSCSAV